MSSGVTLSEDDWKDAILCLRSQDMPARHWFRSLGCDGIDAVQSISQFMEMAALKTIYNIFQSGCSPTNNRYGFPATKVISIRFRNSPCLSTRFCLFGLCCRTWLTSPRTEKPRSWWLSELKTEQYESHWNTRFLISKKGKMKKSCGIYGFTSWAMWQKMVKACRQTQLWLQKDCAFAFGQCRLTGKPVTVTKVARWSGDWTISDEFLPPSTYGHGFKPQ